MGLSVVCPDDLAEGLIYNKGVKNTRVDFIKTNRKSDSIQQWFKAWRAKVNFWGIGRCGEIE